MKNSRESRPLLVAIDGDDTALSSATWEECHLGGGKLHRAVSVFVFTECGKVILQMRSRRKELWPLRWSNTCCGHPRPGESYAEAAGRRLAEETGIETRLERRFFFVYRASYAPGAGEHERCEVFCAVSGPPSRVNPGEIEETALVPPSAIEVAIRRTPSLFTPWFLLEWDLLRRGAA